MKRPSIKDSDKTKIKFLTQTIKDYANRLTSGNYMHHKEGIYSAAEKIDEVLNNSEKNINNEEEISE